MFLEIYMEKKTWELLWGHSGGQAEASQKNNTGGNTVLTHTHTQLQCLVFLYYF